MVEINDNQSITNHKPIRYCGNCKGEYTFENFIQKYSELYHDLATSLWQNPKIRFYCSYCYLLEIIKTIKKKRELKIKLIS